VAAKVMMSIDIMSANQLTILVIATIVVFWSVLNSFIGVGDSGQ